MAEIGEKLARITAQITDELPEGVECVVFLIADVGLVFEAVCASSTTPDAFAPVIRRWLERYDAGEAPGRLVRLPDA